MNMLEKKVEKLENDKRILEEELQRYKEDLEDKRVQIAKKLEEIRRDKSCKRC